MVSKDTDKSDVEVGKKLIAILDELLAKDEWDSSLFLTAMKKKLMALKEEVKSVIGVQTQTLDIDKLNEILAPGKIRVYVLVYQQEGSQLQNWHHALRSLAAHNVNRPTYLSEDHVRELIRSKNDIERYGYAIINIKKDDIYPLEKKQFDVFEHEIIMMKEGAITVNNIVAFVHGNKKYYRFNENTLVYEKELSI